MNIIEKTMTSSKNPSNQVTIHAHCGKMNEDHVKFGKNHQQKHENHGKNNDSHN